MEVHAYPTSATTPVDLAAAQQIAARYLSVPDQLASGIAHQLTEFDGGFVVVAIRGPVPESTSPLPPPVIGGSVSVIDKATGAVSYWPTYPPALIAEQYDEMLRTGRLIVADDWPTENDLEEE
ncbi:hypothetical protein [Nocardia bhagyanarayanae]|uniref:Immunity protein 35 of polymorphic toxin system n=1 Tax=Nocardia bhagyanarayanae TaxID=1215925 RepID=A0A543FBK1_9NOCA|nr:hypothetical protein [Nocardia bhagyanarayanae]TQM31174.1 hypothetical protein FB390_2827 [Nocardia bhagyanarayanae]